MAPQAFVIYLQFGDTHSSTGLSILRELVGRVLPNHRPHYVVVDNTLPPHREYRTLVDETLISGDNSVREFSGYDAGITWCTDRFPVESATPIVVANDTFHRSYGTAYLSLFTEQLVRESLDRRAILGHIDAYPEEAALLGHRFRRWIRTSLFILPYGTCQQLAPLHQTFAPAVFFREDADPRFFADDAPLSDAYRRMLRTWLFAPPDAEALFSESWHSKEPLSPDNVARFREKTCSIFCEHLFSARADACGIPLIDINTHRPHQQERRRHVVVVDHYVPQPDRDAGSRTMVEFMRAMIAIGCEVTFWPQNRHYDPDYTPALVRLGVRPVDLGDRACSVRDWLSRTRPKVDVLLLSRPDVAHELLPVARELGIGPVLYYGHDIHWQRMRLQALVEGHEDPSLSDATDSMRRREEAIWRSADVVLYPSPDEAEFVRSYLRGVGVSDAAARGVARVVPPYSFTPVTAPAGWAGRRDLLFVGGFSHTPNVDAARWVCEEIMPLVWQVSPDVVLQLVGSNPTPAVKALRSRRVEVSGSVSAQELQARYAESLVAVVPLRIGAGVKNKVLEAMAHGVPVVTTSIGAQGLPRIEQCCAVSDAAEDMARSILSLMHSPDRWSLASAAGQTYVRDEFSPAAMERHWTRLLDRAALRALA